MKIPVVSIILMSIFLVGGSIVLVLDWPPGPANLDWGVWILAYFGYLYLIGASLYYVKKGN
jgi:hypothetical protein